MTAIARAVSVGLLSATLLAALPGQEYVRWLEDLGDQQRSEAAERSPIAMGSGECTPPLERATQQVGHDHHPRDRERCLALLRVINLLGADAATLAPEVKQHGTQKPCPLLLQVVNTLASLEPYASDSACHEVFHHAISGAPGKSSPTASFVRFVSRQGVYAQRVFEPTNATAMRAQLTKDEFGAREVAAEALGKLGDKPAIYMLHKRLLDRDKQPQAKQATESLASKLAREPREVQLSLRVATVPPPKYRLKRGGRHGPTLSLSHVCWPATESIRRGR